MKKSSYLLFFFLIFLFSIRTSAQSEQYTHLHVVNYDHPISFEEIKIRYKSYDSIDGDITKRIQFESSYEADLKNNVLEVKPYDLLVTVTNSRNFTLSWTDQIDVRDFTPPIIESTQNEISIDISTEQIEEKILQSISISDNWDKEFHTLFWEGIEDCSTGPGIYLVTLRVQDASGNFSNIVSLIISIFESIQEQITPYSITITKNQLQSAEILTEFLKYKQVDTGYQHAEVSSSYFDSPQKNGVYPASISFSYPDGKKVIYYCKIIVNLETEKKKDDIIIYISLGVILFLLVIGFIIYRKRR
ncbi:MAG: hypothetical protein K2N64_03695 [Anaeroplasmataceae bacterium]|nr:hypothetical protein [Anaeroplasmataceae bacterium]